MKYIWGLCMAVLRVSYDQLESLAQELSAISHESEKLNDRLRSATSILETSWESSEISILTARLNEIQQFEKERAAMLNGLINHINKVLAAYRQTDENIASSFKF